jgi:predicted ATP-grasp superfamily ATP-dependent carboligase
VTGRRHVLVTDAGRGSAVAFIRSLGRRGWRVTAADADPSSPGFRSRYTSRRLVHPQPRDRPDDVVEAILTAVATTDVDLVVPITDEIGLPLSDARSRFEGLTTLALPTPAALAATHDKSATLALARRLGVPVPATRLVADVGEGLATARELGYPIVVKPVSSRQVLADGTIGSYAVTYATDPDELRQRLETPGACPVLLQQWLPGEGIGVELLMDHGRPLAAFQHRRIREVPPTGGASSLRESVPLEPELYDHAVRMLAEVEWTGLAMVEFRRGRDGAGHLMEINGRVWGSLPLATTSGMDFPGRLADLLLDGPPAADEPVAVDYAMGVRARNLRLDLVWVGSVLSGRHRQRSLPYPGRRAAFGALASLLDPWIRDDLLAWSDPSPGLAQIATIARDGFRRSGRRRG